MLAKLKRRTRLDEKFRVGDAFKADVEINTHGAGRTVGADQIGARVTNLFAIALGYGHRLVRRLADARDPRAKDHLDVVHVFEQRVENAGEFVLLALHAVGMACHIGQQR